MTDTDRITALEIVIQGMGNEIDDLTQRITLLEVRLARARVRGPVDLGCEVVNITHLRARGEITLPVEFEGVANAEIESGETEHHG